MRPLCRLVIFDLDGTLVNAYPAVNRSVNEVLRALGFPPRTPTQIKHSVGWGDESLMAQFVGERLAGRAIALYRPHHTKALRAKGGVKFLPGARGILKFLEGANYKLAIASNRPTKFTRIILKTLGVLKLFDVVLCADKAKRPKPYPDMLVSIVQRLNVKKPQALYVGDMTIDVQTGRRAGIRTVAVATGSSSMKELKDLKPYRIISRISLLKSLIKEFS